jgi:hypothetical protein
MTVNQCKQAQQSHCYWDSKYDDKRIREQQSNCNINTNIGHPTTNQGNIDIPQHSIISSNTTTSQIEQAQQRNNKNRQHDNIHKHSLLTCAIFNVFAFHFDWARKNDKGIV